MAFDTYRRPPTLSGPDSASVGFKRQTDKGFRGPFLEFFSTDERGQFKRGLLTTVQSLFARTEGLTALDRALVRALQQRIPSNTLADLSRQFETDLGAVWDTQTWSTSLYERIPERTAYRPLAPFVEQGKRLHHDILGIARSPESLGFSRSEKIHFVERILAYHFSLYLVRLTKTLYVELQSVRNRLLPQSTIPSPWTNRDVIVRYHTRSQRPVSRANHEAYRETIRQVNEAYLLLPVINNIETAIRTVTSRDGAEPVRMENLAWASAKELLADMDGEQRRLANEVLAFLADLGRHYAELPQFSEEYLRGAPICAMFDAVRGYYSVRSRRRYPRDHHGGVFEMIAGTGRESFVTTRPFRHFVLGDELVFLLVLALFEQGESSIDQLSAETRAPRQLRRHRLPLRELERRLTEDLLVPADETARDDLRGTLSRLGLLDRLSDVGDANFLRHPTGI